MQCLVRNGDRMLIKSKIFYRTSRITTKGIQDREKDRNKQPTHLSLKIYGYLKNVLSSACSSHNTTVNPPKSNRNLTAEKKMPEPATSFFSSEFLIKMNLI